MAEVAGEYLRKGSSVYIEGRLQTRKWQDRDGQDRYTTEIIGEIMQMLGGRNNERHTSDSYDGGYTPTHTKKTASDDDMDDDIPF